MLVYETPKNVPETLKDRRAGSPGRRLSMHSKKLRLTWSANHLVRGGASDHFPCVLGVLNFNTPTHQHFNTSVRVAWSATRVLNHIGDRTHREHIECVTLISNVFS